MKIKELINKKYGNNFQNHLLEQYKLYVESADKISLRRDSANHFYLALNSALFVINGYLSSLDKNLIFIVIPLAGIIISYHWLKTINYYSNLNSNKFKIIHQMEKYLPSNPYDYEWSLVGKGNSKIYKPITKVERVTPKVFIGIYVAIILLFLFYNLF